MPNNDYFKNGDWNAYCDICGWKYKFSQLKRDWKGRMVCKEDYDPYHPLDRVRTIPDKQGVPSVHPPPPDVLIEGACTNLQIYGGADNYTAGCARADEEPTVPPGTFANSL